MTLLEFKELIDEYKKEESEDAIFERFFDLCVNIGLDANKTFNISHFVWYALRHEYENIPGEIKNMIDKKSLDLIEEESKKWFIKWGIPDSIIKQIN